MPRKADPARKIHRKRPPKPASQLRIDLAARLRVVQAEMGKTDEGMAEALQVGRTTWTNWLNLENMPAEEAMIRVCQTGRVTLDWLYRGIPDGLQLAHAIRLTARLLGEDPDTATPEVLIRSQQRAHAA